MAAVIEGSVEVARALLLSGDRFQDLLMARDREGFTPLMHAAKMCHANCIRLLLDHASVDAAALQNVKAALRLLALSIYAKKSDPSSELVDCIELMVSLGAPIPRDRNAANVMKPIVRDVFQRALIPGRINMAIVDGLNRVRNAYLSTRDAGHPTPSPQKIDAFHSSFANVGTESTQ